MCQRATCKHCNLVTWRGCGMHVDQVMAGVPKNARCAGHPDLKVGFWDRLLGRG